MTKRFIDRDTLGVGSKVIPEEHEKRRAVFWELLNMDCRMVSMAQIIELRIYNVFHEVTVASPAAILMSGSC